MTVSADISFAGDTVDDGGSAVTITGESVSVDLGETSGTIDSIDDKDDVFRVIDNVTPSVLTDPDLAWTWPASVDGLKVVATQSFENGDDDATKTEMLGSQYITQVGSLADHVSSVSVRYSFGGVIVADGLETVGTTDNTDFNVQYA